MTRKLYWGVLSNGQFYVADADFKILDECRAYSKNGNFSPLTRELGIKYDINLKDFSLMKTESTIEELRENVERYEGLIRKVKLRNACAQAQEVLSDCLNYNTEVCKNVCLGCEKEVTT